MVGKNDQEATADGTRSGRSDVSTDTEPVR
jgi:hypothetical protein